jgi:hypothetical protein
MALRLGWAFTTGMSVVEAENSKEIATVENRMVPCYGSGEARSDLVVVGGDSKCEPGRGSPDNGRNEWILTIREFLWLLCFKDETTIPRAARQFASGIDCKKEDLRRWSLLFNSEKPFI